MDSYFGQVDSVVMGSSVRLCFSQYFYVLFWGELGYE